MQNTTKIKPYYVLVMITMVFCMVFTPCIKISLPLTDTEKKASLESHEEKADEKEISIEAELFAKNNHTEEQYSENLNHIRFNYFCYTPLKISFPYSKPHTPPPELSRRTKI